MLKRARRISTDKQVDFSASSATLDAEISEWVGEQRRPMGELLLAQGAINSDQLLDALEVQQAQGGRLGDILLAKDLVDEHMIAHVLADQFGIEFADLRMEDPDPAAVERVSEELARRHLVIPLRIEADDRIALVTGEPLSVDAIRELTQHCNRIRLLVGARSDISRMLDRAYNALSLADEHIQAFELIDLEDEAAASSVSLEVDENAPIVQVVNRILIQAARARASDVHIEPHEKSVVVRFRIDGALSEAITLPRRMGPPVASRLKVMSDLNIVERRRPQDGQFSVQVDHRPIDVRISVVGTIHGEKIVLRLLDKTRSLIGLKQMGMPADLLEPYLEIVKAPLGMLLCTGPTGSGKTTTLYATLTQVQDPTKNVVTIEDPVEYQFAGINQMPINEQAGMSFADGLRGILRQDPDIILVGEIRDVETARIATQAALTGHFVLSSLHAVDAVSAIHRFTDMGIEPFLVASAISGVVGQRLLRRICNSCRETYTPHPDHVRLTEGFAGEVPAEWVRGAGCNLCSGTGYVGRVGVYELLQVSDSIRDAIVSKATAREIRTAAISEGMRTMQQEAFRLVAQGVTTVDDVLRSVYAPGMEADLEEDRMALDLSDGTPLGTVIDLPLPPVTDVTDRANGSTRNGATADAAAAHGDAVINGFGHAVPPPPPAPTGGPFGAPASHGGGHTNGHTNGSTNGTSNGHHLPPAPAPERPTEEARP